MSDERKAVPFRRKYFFDYCVEMSAPPLSKSSCPSPPFSVAINSSLSLVVVSADDVCFLLLLFALSLLAKKTRRSASFIQRFSSIVRTLRSIQPMMFDEKKSILNHPLMKRIDLWEEESIAQIRQTANDVRDELKRVLIDHQKKILEKSKDVQRQIEQIRSIDDSNEIHIQYWMDKLNQLKRDFLTPKTINIRPDPRAHTHIHRIKLSQTSLDTFHCPVGDADIFDQGVTIRHGPSNGDGTVRSEGSYSTGLHRFRFQIERLSVPKWVFFGIVSEKTPLQASLHKTPTVYGWAGHQQVWLNGVHHHQYDGYHMEFDTENVIELFLDCREHRMRLTNETTLMTHQIDISPSKCPFPWVVYLGLYGSNDCIRLLYA